VAANKKNYDEYERIVESEMDEQERRKARVGYLEWTRRDSNS
jgi:hypothetical protein